MTMASRDIANMHLFLDLKKKFPDLPDEILRSYTSLFAEDQERCLSLLQKESENHYHPSQPFSDFRLPDSKLNYSRRNDHLKYSAGNPNEGSFLHLNSEPSSTPSAKKLPPASGRSSSHAGVIHLPGKFLSPNTSSKPESLSAPVITGNEKPFNDIYKQNSISSHTSLCQMPSHDRSNQIMFHTTKNHIIEAPTSRESSAYVPVSGKSEPSRRHAVELSITPSFPFQQQHVNVFNNSVCASASHTSRPGRHTTSLNFQLQPQSSDQFPLEISTIPTNIGSPCNSRDFGSHVQISVGAQGATFTAVRLQRPTFTSQTQNACQPSIAEEGPQECIPSSQAQNSSLYFLPNPRIHPLPSLGTNESFRYQQVQGATHSQKMYSAPKNHPSAQMGSAHSNQSSPDYILAVKNHQIAQLDLILSELEKEKAVCSQLRAEVNRMEQQVAERNASTTSFPYPCDQNKRLLVPSSMRKYLTEDDKNSLTQVEELQKLREEVRNLSVEISCLSMEVDSAGQIPLGVTDEDFYENIFTGPNGALMATQEAPRREADAENIRDTLKKKSSLGDDEDDEKNRWLCKKCTFANHPALEKCEMCELPKNFDCVECNSGYSSSTSFRFVSSPKQQQPRRAVGSVQISVTRRVPASKSVKLQLTHRLPR